MREKGVLTPEMPSPPSQQPRLSVVIPVYNEESILREACVELMERLDQRGWDYELVLTENGSRDRTRRDPGGARRGAPAPPLPRLRRAELRARAPTRHPRRTRLLRRRGRDRPLRRHLLRSRARRARRRRGGHGDRLEARARLARQPPRLPPPRHGRAQHAPPGRARVPGHRHARGEGVPPRRRSHRPPSGAWWTRTSSPASSCCAPGSRGSACIEIPITLAEKRPPSIALFKRVPNVLRQVATPVLGAPRSRRRPVASRLAPPGTAVARARLPAPDEVVRAGGALASISTASRTTTGSTGSPRRPPAPPTPSTERRSIASASSATGSVSAAPPSASDGTYRTTPPPRGRCGSWPRPGTSSGTTRLSHDYRLTTRAREDIAAEVQGGADAIATITGSAPLGFRAPGYTLSPVLLEVLAAAGYRYDSSAFPSLPYYAAKAAVMGLLAITRRPSGALLDHPRVLRAPRTPYRPSPTDPYRRGTLGILELPITTGLLGFPLVGTFVATLPAWLARAVARRDGRPPPLQPGVARDRPPRRIRRLARAGVAAARPQGSRHGQDRPHRGVRTEPGRPRLAPPVGRGGAPRRARRRVVMVAHGQFAVAPGRADAGAHVRAGRTRDAGAPRQARAARQRVRRGPLRARRRRDDRARRARTVALPEVLPRPGLRDRERPGVRPRLPRSRTTRVSCRSTRS